MTRTLKYNNNLKNFFITSIAGIFCIIGLICFTNALDTLTYGFYDTWLELNNYTVSFGMNGINIGLVILTLLLVPICLVSTIDTERYNNHLYSFIFGSFLVLLLGAFTTSDLLIFYIMFEGVLIPIFILVGVWGSRSRRIKAAYYSLSFTVIGSILFLYSLFLIYSFFGTTNFNFLILNIDLIPLKLQKLIWLFFLVTFLVKIPSLPFHIWLPEAHVEAPTTGSIVLAGLLLKLGTFGVLKYNILLFPEISEYYSIYVYIIALTSILYSSFITLRQLDLKRIIAYSSVAHTNVVLIGIFSFSLAGITGSIILIVAHGIVSSALFFLIGVLYNRYHNRFVSVYGGLASVMPLFSSFLFVFVLSNFSVPLTSNFIGEFFVLIGLSKVNFLLTILVAGSTIITLIYSLWFYNRLCFGALNTRFIKIFNDINRVELSLLGLFILWNVIIGCYPKFLNAFIEPTLIYYI